MKILVTGVSSQSPMGSTEEEIVSNLRNEKLCFTPYDDIHGIIKSKVKSTCDFKHDSLPRSMDSPMASMSLSAIHGAMLDGGFDDSIFSSRNTALCSAIGIPSIDNIRVLVDNTKRASAFDIIKTVPTSTTGALATHLKIKGPVHTVQHACASGLRAITQGMDLINLGKAYLVVCVVAEMITHETMKGFDAMRALYRGDDLEQPSKPFSADRGGFVFGEGVGCVILESEWHYLHRKGKKNYGEVLWYADYSDGDDITNPSGVAAATCMRDVVTCAIRHGIDIDFVSAHATATPNGDAAEAKAIYDVFGDNVPVVALKRLYGHMVTASAMVEFIHCLYMMKYNFIVSNGDVKLDPKLAPINLPKEQINKPVNGFIKNAFGFGGLNSVIAVRKS